MEVLLFTNFSKRKNSTKRPDDSTGILKDIKIKGNFGFENQNQSVKCSLVHPSFFLADAEHYSYLKAWGNYYFIDTVAYDINGAQYITCTIDVLATWKTEILGTTAYVKYSSSQYDTRIIDTRIPRKTDVAIRHNTYESIFDESADNVFFITVGGENSSTAFRGGYNYYMFTEYGWNGLCAKLCNDDFLDDIKKIFVDVASGLISARRMPIKTSEVDIEDVSAIDIGRASITYPANKLASTYIHPDPIEMTIPLYKDDFNEWSPFRRLKLYIPYIGTIDLPTDIFHDNTILLDYVVDLTTGLMEINICAHSLNNKMITLSAEVGGQLPTSVNNVNLLKVASNGASALGAIATGNPVGALEQAASAVSTGLTDNITSKGIFGGGRSEYLGTDFILYSIDWQPVFNANNADYIALHGRPCYRVIPLTNLTGYVETINFSIDIASTTDIKDMINSALDTGIYIE